MRTVNYTDRPLVVSGGLAVLAGLVAVRLVANAPAQVAALGVTAVGLGGIAIGMEAWYRDYRTLGAAGTLAGLAVALYAIGQGVGSTAGITPKLVLVPGIVGIVLLTLGVVAVLPGYERWFVSGGAAAVLVAVFFSGFARNASTVALLAATAATVVAWDAGEQSVNMGEQLDRAADTWRVEVVHWGVGVLVGGIGLLVAVAIGGVGVTGLPLVGLAAMLVAAVVFLITFYT